MGGGGTNEPGMMRPTQARIARRLLRGFRARGLDILNTSSEPEPDGACCLRKRGVDGNVPSRTTYWSRAYEGYAKRTMERALAATRKRHAHRLTNVTGTDVQNDPQNRVQNDFGDECLQAK
jgi:hypothetical protein